MDIWSAIHLALGILGNLISISLFLSPISTFKKIHEKKTVGGFSCAPYLSMVLNCSFWVGYGVILKGVDRILVTSTNGVGLLLSLTYVVLFAFYAGSTKRKRVLFFLVLEMVVVAALVTPIILKFFVMAANADNKKRGTTILGSLGITANLLLYASPLSIMIDVITSRSVEFLPLSTSLASLANGLIWSIYAAHHLNVFILAPNVVGCLLALAQLILYMRFRKYPTRDEHNEPT